MAHLDIGPRRREKRNWGTEAALDRASFKTNCKTTTTGPNSIATSQMGIMSRISMPSPAVLAVELPQSQSPASSLAPPLSSLSQASPATIAKLLRDKTRLRLLAYEDVPEWYQDNEFIRHGYRPVLCSARVSFASWLYLHNESVNILSHLIPAIGFLLGEWYIQDCLHGRYPGVTSSDHLIFAFFLLAATTCLSLSATYHTMINHSHQIESLWLSLDLVGIVVLILGDFVSDLIGLLVRGTAEEDLLVHGENMSNSAQKVSC